MEINPYTLPTAFKRCLDSLIERIGWVGDSACHLNLRVNVTCLRMASVNYNQETSLEHLTSFTAYIDGFPRLLHRR